VLCYWKHGRFLFHNYATGNRAGGSAFACDVLNLFEDWKPIQALFDNHPDLEHRALEQLVAALADATLLLRSDRPQPAEEQAMSKLDPWNPEAGFFHSATKDVKFVDIRTGEKQMRHQARSWPMPAPVKRYPGARVVKLDTPGAATPVEKSILARRSWRRFGTGKLPLSTFGALLGLTAGVQKWVKVYSNQRVALKTSPSGGARHPVELYTLAWGIRGLRTGLYHYAADIHGLELIRAGLGSSRVPAYLPHGDYWSEACALIIFSAVYERDLWRYGYSRAYRAPFIEAGHLCQTFLLLATSYGLAPFSAMGLADSVIEKDLGVDGVGESVLYVAGVGLKPPAPNRAPAPHGFDVPKIVPNPYLHRAVKHRR
jgi:SagB-type dehydrogenase family enzyme